MYDCIIIGAGPAGCSAAVYAKQNGLNVLVIECNEVGGSPIAAKNIKNFPSLSEISGVDLANNFKKQLEYNNINIVKDVVMSTNLVQKTVFGDIGTYLAKSIIIATGTSPAKLNAHIQPNATVYYNYMKDINVCKDKVVTVIGGGNSALSYAQNIATVAKQVNIVHHSDKFSAQQELIDSINKPNISVYFNTEVERIENGFITTNNEMILNDITMICIGRKINYDFCSLDKTHNGITVNSSMETSVPGIYAIGDVVDKKNKQIITACADGAIAVKSILNYLKSN